MLLHDGVLARGPLSRFGSLRHLTFRAICFNGADLLSSTGHFQVVSRRFSLVQMTLGVGEHHRGPSPCLNPTGSRSPPVAP